MALRVLRQIKKPISDKCELQPLDSTNHYSLIKFLSPNFDSGSGGHILLSSISVKKRKKAIDKKVLFNRHQASLTLFHILQSVIQNHLNSYLVSQRKPFWTYYIPSKF